MKPLYLLTSILCSTSMVHAASILTDGEFDLATSGSTTSGSPWTLTVNSPDGTNPAAQFQTGFANANNTGAGGTQAPGTGAGLWIRSFEGDQGGSGEPLANANLSQSVLAPSSGSYQLSFVAGREVNFTAASFGVTLSSSGVAGSATIDLIAATIPDGNLGGAASLNAGGTPFSITLNSVMAGDTLQVSAIMVDGADSQVPGGQSAFLDNFSLVLAPVPEPSSSLLLASSALLLFKRRR
ncbi:hypothetical protein NT6N_30410 [Oceaniferula spumae]|uniref:Ice-binding protein C-terminal domain-containing protein n=1 Tax=Oceaniferula spumae TaxID=2979115 RepID=A0AAT9FPS9_9BACT